MNPSSHRKGRRSRGSRGTRSGEGSDSSHPVGSSASSRGRRKKKDGFSSKIQNPEFGGKKGHSGEVTDAFRQWVRCITYYRDYYEDSYLMPLVVSSLTGDASVVFNWILSLNQGEPQDLTTLLQMLREHYCERSHNLDRSFRIFIQFRVSPLGSSTHIQYRMRGHGSIS